LCGRATCRVAKSISKLNKQPGQRFPLRQDLRNLRSTNKLKTTKSAPQRIQIHKQQSCSLCALICLFCAKEQHASSAIKNQQAALNKKTRSGRGKLTEFINCANYGQEAAIKKAKTESKGNIYANVNWAAIELSHEAWRIRNET